MTETRPRIYLSPPHLGVAEERLVADVFASNWIAPLGPHVDAFERSFGEKLGTPHAVALSSGTAALHLALLLSGVGPGDEVAVSSLTFAASANPIRYVGATPVFVDSERASWNLDPDLLITWLNQRARAGRTPKAVIIVHLYGQSADLDPILAACAKHGVVVIEDAAEALGATYKGKAPGTFGRFGVFSFNGNKVITTSGGGMLVSADAGAIAHARKLATQARDPAPHYEHSEIGFNYRMSNVLAAIGRGQLEVLDDRVAARRGNFAFYEQALKCLPGVEFQPEAAWGKHSRWLTTMLITPQTFGADRDDVRLALERENIEARPLWKPMHLQPVYAGCECLDRGVAADLFARGLCLPSGSSLSPADRERVVAVVKAVQA
jgi:pyridoxal phosphate-dependent aminotransferase EpsN